MLGTGSAGLRSGQEGSLMVGIYDPSADLGIDHVISMQCVNYHMCGGNVGLIVRHGLLSMSENSTEQDAEVQVFRQTCPCRYSQEDLSQFRREVALGRVHP